MPYPTSSEGSFRREFPASGQIAVLELSLSNVNDRGKPGVLTLTPGNMDPHRLPELMRRLCDDLNVASSRFPKAQGSSALRVDQHMRITGIAVENMKSVALTAVTFLKENSSLLKGFEERLRADIERHPWPSPARPAGGVTAFRYQPS